MTHLPRPTLAERVRSALLELSRPTAARPRLARVHVPIESGRFAARGSWLLLADGRPALRLSRRPR
jgi:hypothetical protein